MAIEEEQFNVYEELFISQLLNSPLLKNEITNFKPEYLSNQELQKIYKAITPEKTFPQICRDLTNEVNAKYMIGLLDLEKLPSASMVQYYGEIVIEGYKRREIKKLDGSFFNDIYKKVNALQSISVIPEKEEDTAEAFLRHLEEIYKTGSDSDTIPTGFAPIDKLIRGFGRSELIVIGGRPAMGKSTIGANIAYNCARNGKKVAYFSLEMSKLDLHKRLVKMITGIENLYRIDQDKFDKCCQASKYIENELSLKIYDKADVTVEGIRSKCAKLKNDNEIDMVVIDHISILKSDKQFRGRVEEMSEISRQLKVTAKEIECPVIALCQLNRGLENRDVKIPTLADIRDSGTIEQDADLVCFVHRDEYYILQKNEEVPADKKGVANFLISKNRRGGVGMTTLGFNPKIPTFY